VPQFVSCVAARELGPTRALDATELRGGRGRRLDTVAALTVGLGCDVYWARNSKKGKKKGKRDYFIE